MRSAQGGQVHGAQGLLRNPQGSRVLRLLAGRLVLRRFNGRLAGCGADRLGAVSTGTTESLRCMGMHALRFTAAHSGDVCGCRPSTTPPMARSSRDLSCMRPWCGTRQTWLGRPSRVRAARMSLVLTHSGRASMCGCKGRENTTEQENQQKKTTHVEGTRRTREISTVASEATATKCQRWYPALRLL